MSDWRRTPQYRLWRILCKRRDGWKCTVTGLTEDLQVHHINSGSHHPDQRFDVDNGITLHSSVHASFHLTFMKSYRHKCTREDWERFMRYEKYNKQRIAAMLHQYANIIEYDS